MAGAAGRHDQGAAGAQRPTDWLVARPACIVALAAVLVAAMLAGGSAHASASTRVALSRQPVEVVATSSLAVRGIVTGAGARARLRVRLERRAAGRWRGLTTAGVGRGKRFALRWQAPALPGRMLMRVAAVTTSGRRVAASSSWWVTVRRPRAGPFDPLDPTDPEPNEPVDPGGGPLPNPSPGGSTVPVPAPPAPPPPTPRPPAPQEFDAAPLVLHAGTREPALLPSFVAVEQLSTDSAGPLSLEVEEGGTLMLAAPADAPLGHRELRVTARGCVAQQCDQELTIRIPVEVVSPAAPPGAVEDFPAPSPDRLDQARPLPSGLPGQRLQDELVLTLGTDDEPGTRADADAAAAAVGAVVTGGVDAVGVYSVNWGTPQDLAARRAQLLAQPGVTAVTFRELDTVDTTAVPPGDWADDGQEVIWPFVQIRATEAWDWQQGGYFRVGIVDRGRVQANHEDLLVAAEVGPKIGATAHATHVAGLACAQANGIGLVGVAWGCPIVTSGTLVYSDEDVLAAAVTVALEPGVGVINISLGPPLGAARCATQAEHEQRMLAGEAHAAWFRRLFTRAGKDIVWTLSAGNNCENAAPSPWAQNGDLPNVLVVAATNSDRTLASFSTYGHDVEVAAPGGVDVTPPRNGTVGLWSTWRYGAHVASRPECGPGYRYCWESGTSMAAPMVAGVAELIRSANASYSADEVAECIVRTAVGRAEQSVYPRGFDPQISFEPADAPPIVDAAAAVRCKPGEFDVTIGDGTPIPARMRAFLSVRLSAGGGTAPYEWALEEWVSDPINGLSLSRDGVLSGTPIYAGRLDIPVRLIDATGDVAQGVVTVKVAYGSAPPIAGHATRLTSGNNNTYVSDISSDGSSVLAVSYATNLTSDPVRTTDGADVFTIDTATRAVKRITTGTGTSDWAHMSADGSTVVFRSTATDLVSGPDPNGDGYDLYVWRRASGSITRIAPGVNSIASITDDGSRVLYIAGESRARFFLVATATGITTEITISPLLEPRWSGTLSGDGTKLLYTARPPGSNLVWFVHVLDLASGTDTDLHVQSAGTVRFADDARSVVYGTYSGIFNEGTAVVTLATGGWIALDGGRNTVYDARTAPSGTCFVVGSWEPSNLTDDEPNRGRVLFYTDLFSYDMRSQRFRRLTNTYSDDLGGSGVAVANDCAVVAFDVSPGAIDPDLDEVREPHDVFTYTP